MTQIKCTNAEEGRKRQSTPVSGLVIVLVVAKLTMNIRICLKKKDEGHQLQVRLEEVEEELSHVAVNQDQDMSLPLLHLQA